MDKDDVVAGLIAERTALIALLRDTGLAADAPTLCEGWVVRDVVAHLVGNCADVVAGRLEGVGSEAYNQRQIDERAGRSMDELLDEWESAGPAAESFYAAITPDLWAAELPGLGTVGLGVTRHLYDLWIHVNDIMIPSGARPAAGPGARAALDIVTHELPRRLRHTTIGSLTMAFDDMREQVVVGPGDAVAVTGDLAAFLLACVGREDLARAVDDGRLSFEPVLAAADAAAFNIYASR